MTKVGAGSTTVQMILKRLLHIFSIKNIDYKHFRSSFIQILFLNSFIKSPFSNLFPPTPAPPALLITMRNTKLHALLHHFSASERLLFRKFLRSPYFNQRSDLVCLFDIWEKNFTVSDKETDEETIWQAIQPGKSFKKTSFIWPTVGS
jgi:hypothetical protein